MNNACPGCGAVYNVTAKDVGRRLRCKKCSTPMLITAEGIAADDGLDAAPPPPPVDPFPEPIPAPRPSRDRSRAGGFDARGAAERLGGLSTLVFGFGAFLVIFHLFMPLVGDAKVKRRQAAITEGQIDLAAAEKRYADKKDKKPEDDKNIKELRDNWEKTKASLEDDVAAARVANDKSLYWDRYFMMFGFLAVMVGSLAFMRADQPPIKRVVGGVVVATQMVLVFLAFLGRSVSVG